MTDQPKKPTIFMLILWAVPAIASLIFLIAALILHRGAEIGFGALLASILYFAVRYGMHTQDTPPQ